MIDINDEAIKKLKMNKNAEGLLFLKRAEKTLEVNNVISFFFETCFFESSLRAVAKVSTEMS